MKIEKLNAVDDKIIYELLTVWEKSVRSSHHFLQEEDIDQYLPSVDIFVILNIRGHIEAFMGLKDDMLEMLFVLPEKQRNGYGRALVNHAIYECGIYKVDVNEDNLMAYSFYLKMGYEVIGRDEYDAMGKPFPIIHLLHKRS